MHKVIRFIILLSLGLLLQDSLYAKKDLVKRRQERLAMADAPWSEPKVTINVHHRVAIYDTLGYLAASYDEPGKFAQLLQRVRPIADKVNRLSQGSLSGRSFPQSLAAELRADEGAMFAAVKEIYGNAILVELRNYLDKKQAAMNTGILGLIE